MVAKLPCELIANVGIKPLVVVVLVKNPIESCPASFLSRIAILAHAVVGPTEKPTDALGRDVSVLVQLPVRLQRTLERLVLYLSQ